MGRCPCRACMLHHLPFATPLFMLCSRPLPLLQSQRCCKGTMCRRSSGAHQTQVEGGGAGRGRAECKQVGLTAIWLARWVQCSGALDLMLGSSRQNACQTQLVGAGSSRAGDVGAGSLLCWRCGCWRPAHAGILAMLNVWVLASWQYMVYGCWMMALGTWAAGSDYLGASLAVHSGAWYDGAPATAQPALPCAALPLWQPLVLFDPTPLTAPVQHLPAAPQQLLPPCSGCRTLQTAWWPSWWGRRASMRSVCARRWSASTQPRARPARGG